MATFTPWPGARRVLTSAPGQRRPGRSPGLGSECTGEAGGGRGYLLQSLCSMLYTSSSRLRPSKNGMRSSSSVSVMSSNQDCTGTWKTGRGGQQACTGAGGSQPDWVPVFLRTCPLVRRPSISPSPSPSPFCLFPRPNRDQPKATWLGVLVREGRSRGPSSHTVACSVFLPQKGWPERRICEN